MKTNNYRNTNKINIDFNEHKKLSVSTNKLKTTKVDIDAKNSNNEKLKTKSNNMNFNINSKGSANNKSYSTTYNNVRATSATLNNASVTNSIKTTNNSTTRKTTPIASNVINPNLKNVAVNTVVLSKTIINPSRYVLKEHLKELGYEFVTNLEPTKEVSNQIKVIKNGYGLGKSTIDISKNSVHITKQTLKISKQKLKIIKGSSENLALKTNIGISKLYTYKKPSLKTTDRINNKKVIVKNNKSVEKLKTKIQNKEIKVNKAKIKADKLDADKIKFNDVEKMVTNKVIIANAVGRFVEQKTDYESLNEKMQDDLDTANAVTSEVQIAQKIHKSFNNSSIKSSNNKLDKISFKNEHLTETLNKIESTKNLKTAKLKLKTTKNTPTKIKGNIKNTKKVGTKAVNSTKYIANLVKTLSKKAVSAVGAKGILIIVVIVVIVLLLMTTMSSSDAMVMSTITTPMADDDVMELYVTSLSNWDKEANEYLNELLDQTDTYDDIVLNTSGTDSKNISSSIREFLTILAIKEEQNLTAEKLNILKEMHENSYRITTETETYIEIELQYPKDENGKPMEDEEPIEVEVEKTRLIINLWTADFEWFMDFYEFDEDQREWAEIMLQGNFSDVYPDLHLYGNVGLSTDEINAILENADTTEVGRLEVVQKGLSLVGITQYGWGCRAGYDVQYPSKLDCSGFTDWVFGSSGVTSMFKGTNTTAQYDKTIPINQSDLLPGDLGFKQYTTSETNANHVGIYIGNGKWVHCQSGTGVTVDDGRVFKFFRRVPINFNE